MCLVDVDRVPLPGSATASPRHGAARNGIPTKAKGRVWWVLWAQVGYRVVGGGVVRGVEVGLELLCGLLVGDMAWGFLGGFDEGW